MPLSNPDIANKLNMLIFFFASNLGGISRLFRVALPYQSAEHVQCYKAQPIRIMLIYPEWIGGMKSAKEL